MYRPNQAERVKSLTPKAQKPTQLNLSSKISHEDELSDLEGKVTTKAKILSRMNPNITPNAKADKLLDQARPLSTRSNTSHASVEPSGHQSRLRSRPTTKESDLNISEENGKRLYQTSVERKLLEQQYKQMQNRIRHLKDEDQKIKSKILETKKKTEMLIKTKERYHQDRVQNAIQKSARERMIQEKKDRAIAMKIQSQENLRKIEERFFREKQNKAAEIKNELVACQNLREELKKEEDLKNCEKVWKVACQEKKVENTKLYERVQKRNEMAKRFNDKLDQEQSKTEELSEKIKELEDMESKLLENLKMSQATHITAFQEMQQVYSSNDALTNQINGQ